MLSTISDIENELLGELPSNPNEPNPHDVKTSGAISTDSNTSKKSSANNLLKPPTNNLPPKRFKSNPNEKSSSIQNTYSLNLYLQLLNQTLPTITLTTPISAQLLLFHHHKTQHSKKLFKTIKKTKKNTTQTSQHILNTYQSLYTEKDKEPFSVFIELSSENNQVVSKEPTNTSAGKNTK